MTCVLTTTQSRTSLAAVSIENKLCLLAYKSIICHVIPVYMNYLPTVVADVPSIGQRFHDATNGNFVVPRIYTVVKLGERTFSVAAPQT